MKCSQVRDAVSVESVHFTRLCIYHALNKNEIKKVNRLLYCLSEKGEREFREKERHKY